MSGFDGMFRTQALTGGWQLEGARRRESARQADIQAFQNQQALQQRQVESDAKVAAWVQEQQLNDYKLRMMSGLDAAKMGRLQTEQAELGVERERLGLEVERKKFDSVDLEDQKIDAEISRLRAMALGSTTEDRIAAGGVMEGGRWRPARNEQESVDFARRMGNLKKLMGDNDPLARNRLGQEFARIFGDVSNPMTRYGIKRDFPDLLPILDKTARSLAHEYAGQFEDWGAGRETPPPGEVDTLEPDPTQGPAAKDAPAGNPFPPDSPAGKIYADPRWESDDPYWGEIGKERDTRARMSDAMGAWGAWAAGRMGWRPEMIPGGAFSAAETKPQVLGFVLMASGMSEADVRRVLKRRFDMNEAALNFQMQYVDVAVKDVLRQLGEGR